MASTLTSHGAGLIGLVAVALTQRAEVLGKRSRSVVAAPVGRVSLLLAVIIWYPLRAKARAGEVAATALSDEDHPLKSPRCVGSSSIADLAGATWSATWLGRHRREVCQLEVTATDKAGDQLKLMPKVPAVTQALVLAGWDTPIVIRSVADLLKARHSVARLGSSIGRRQMGRPGNRRDPTVVCALIGVEVRSSNHIKKHRLSTSGASTMSDQLVDLIKVLILSLCSVVSPAL